MRMLWAMGLLWAFPLYGADVPDDPAEVRPLFPGQSAPAFTAVNAHGETYAYDPAGRTRPAIVIFYRGGWCPYCNLYWAELRKIETELLALDMDLLFISADRPEMLADAVEDGQRLPYELLSDAGSEIAQAFGIAFRVDDATFDRYRSNGIDLEQISGRDHHRLPVPATFIIDAQGLIRFSFVNPDYQVRLHPQVLLTAARTMVEYRLERPPRPAQDADE